MFDEQTFYRLVLSIVGAATTLLGSVGIFVSLTIQRRVEKLQDILEEFLDLSYHNDNNITGSMYKLIEKYQMHYMFPDTPVRIIIHYINFTILTVFLSWTAIMIEDITWSWSWMSLLKTIPVLLGLVLLVFYRILLKNIIYPFGNNMMSPLIPPPAQLRSVSFLSRYVNVSVKSILRQARLRLLIKPGPDGQAKVILKEEISFDDYLYYLVLSAGATPIFVAYGKLDIHFGNEPVTGKPVPVAKNVNIPMGFIPEEQLTEENYEAKLFIFPKGEKHPLEYVFNLKKQGEIIVMTSDPELSVNYMITYQIDHDKLMILKGEADPPFFTSFFGISFLKGRRFSCLKPVDEDKFQPCSENIYID